MRLSSGRPATTVSGEGSPRRRPRPGRSRGWPAAGLRRAGAGRAGLAHARMATGAAASGSRAAPPARLAREALEHDAEAGLGEIRGPAARRRVTSARKPPATGAEPVRMMEPLDRRRARPALARAGRGRSTRCRRASSMRAARSADHAAQFSPRVRRPREEDLRGGVGKVSRTASRCPRRASRCAAASRGAPARPAAGSPIHRWIT